MTRSGLPRFARKDGIPLNILSTLRDDHCVASSGRTVWSGERLNYVTSQGERFWGERFWFVLKMIKIPFETPASRPPQGERGNYVTPQGER